MREHRKSVLSLQSGQGRSFEFDFSGLRIGCAEYPEGPTGVSVFHFPERVFAAVDCRGGAAATSLTDLLRVNYNKYVDGIVFAGGSAYGLEAASGVSASLLNSRSASTSWERVAIVPGGE